MVTFGRNRQTVDSYRSLCYFSPIPLTRERFERPGSVTYSLKLGFYHSLVRVPCAPSFSSGGGKALFFV